MTQLAKITAKSGDHLRELVHTHIRKYGNNCNLNHIDTQHVESMACLFQSSDFNGDISEWNVSKVTNARDMFAWSKFNGDLSKWNVEQLRMANGMFHASSFEGDISSWRPNGLEYANAMFSDNRIKHPIQWTLPRCQRAYKMFEKAHIEAPITLTFGYPAIVLESMFQDAKCTTVPLLQCVEKYKPGAEKIFMRSNIPLHDPKLYAFYCSTTEEPTFDDCIKTYSNWFMIPKDGCKKRILDGLAHEPALNEAHILWNLLHPTFYRGAYWTPEVEQQVSIQREILQHLGKNPLQHLLDIRDAVCIEHTALEYETMDTTTASINAQLTVNTP